MVLVGLGLATGTGSGGGGGEARAAVLLSGDRVTGLSVLCNAVVTGDHSGIEAGGRPTGVATAAHCLDGADAVAVAGADVCAANGWIVHPLPPATIETGDLATLWDTPESTPDERQVRAGDRVRVVGFGRADGHGSASCDRQVLTAEVASDERCRSVVGPDDAGVLGCLDGVALCPGWSGAGVYGDGGDPIGLIVGGTTCEAGADGLVVYRRLGVGPAPPPTRIG